MLFDVALKTGRFVLRFRRNRRRAWSALLLSTTFSASLLSFVGTSDGQQATNPQQMLQSALQHQQQELEQLLRQHEIQRQAVIRAIEQLGSATPVDHAAVEILHAQLVELHKRQDEEKQSLSRRQNAETNVLRDAVNPQPGAVEDIDHPEPLDMDQLRELALSKESLPTPVVVDRSFTNLGTVNDLVIQDETAAIQLGKALFWDVQVGSDNKTSCATCHNFGGADWRTKNQLASGGNHQLDLGSGRTRRTKSSSLGCWVCT